ncbi:MAG: HNH endonuclease [Saprospiraceae bacterium]|nr:HNH endonuclease [Saprospiraceae bacterium]
MPPQNTKCMPLLLAAANLDHKMFSEIVNIIERMMFRYTSICGQHHQFITDIYEAEAVNIRTNTGGYNLNNLKTKLQNLLNSRADDRLFRASLDSLIYKKNGGSNKPLKYFLITLEDYWRWFHEDGAVGQPVCKDKSRLYAFGDTTIEHIYPYSAVGATFDASIDELKNTIGNLTILGLTDNVAGANDSFIVKLPIFRASSVSMNHELTSLSLWNRAEVLKRTEKLKDMAVKIFKIA